MIELVIAWAAREAAGWWYKRRARAELERQFKELAARARLAEQRLAELIDKGVRP